MGHVVGGIATDDHELCQASVGLGSSAEFLGKEGERLQAEGKKLCSD